MSYIHDPNASLRYGQDWTDWLATGETITAASATVVDVKGIETPAVMTISAVTPASPFVYFTAAGGTVGVDYEVTIHATSSLGEVDDRTTRLKCRQR